MMLEELPAEAIPTADSKKLQPLHRILQQSRMPGWPVECLQPEISTPEFDVVISEIAEFASKPSPGFYGKIGAWFLAKGPVFMKQSAWSNLSGLISLPE